MARKAGRLSGGIATRAMSHKVTELVRSRLLPAHLSRQKRQVLKSVLLTLADRCDDLGENAFPSVATMAAAAEVSSKRTVDAALQGLEALNLISKQAPPSQHRPRTWRLHLPAIAALQGWKDLARRNHPESQPIVATLTNKPESQMSSPESQLSASGSQIQPSGSQARVATERIERTERLNKARTREGESDRGFVACGVNGCENGFRPVVNPQTGNRIRCGCRSRHENEQLARELAGGRR